MNTKKIYKTAFYGFIIGDILGLPVEAKNREYLIDHPITDMIGHEIRKTRVGYWSDDTSMCLCTMESIIECNKIDYKNLMDKFVIWAAKGYMTVDNRKFFGVGERTFKSLDFYCKELEHPTFSKEYNNDEWILKVGELSVPKNKTNYSGNGSLMRILPVIFYLYNKEISIEEKIKIICDMSSITHHSDDCKASCIFYMFLIYNLLEKKEKIEAINISKEQTSKYYDISKCEGINRIYKNNLLDKDIFDLKTTGYVIDTLESILVIFNTCNNYREAILIAVNLGGDTDTIAALTGALAAIYYGKESISDKWINKILKKDMIDKITEEFINVI